MEPKTLLVADDDRLIRITLARGLRDAGYEVLEAADGEEAVSLGCESLPQLAILDVRMPKMSGIEAAKILRERARVPCIFLSAYNDTQVVRQAVEEGAHGYLVKPLDVAQMLPTIESALTRSTDLEKLRESETHLTTALAKGRETSMAVGILMARSSVSEDTAFESLRAYARSHRRKVADVAVELIEATSTMNSLVDEILQTQSTTPSDNP